MCWITFQGNCPYYDDSVIQDASILYLHILTYGLLLFFNLCCRKYLREKELLSSISLPQPRCDTCHFCSFIWSEIFTGGDICKGMLLSHKKEHIWVSSNEVDEPRAYYTGWSKSEREKQILYVNAYIWNLEAWYWWICSQSSNRDTDIEDRLMDKGGHLLVYVNREPMGIWCTTQGTQTGAL